jgi:hypothetical protein
MRGWLGVAAAASLVAVAPRAALAGPPFVTDDPEPVEQGHWEVYAFSDGAFDGGSATGVGPAIEVNYGAAPDLQLHFIGAPAYDAPAGQPRQYGLGDIELGAKYRLINPGKDDWYPQVGIFPLLTMPTGDARRGLGGGYVAAFLPVWLQKDYGAWTTYGGGGYWINPGPGNRNYWFAGWLVQRQVTKTLALGGEVFRQTSSMVGRRASSGFSLGGVYDFTDHYHLLFSAGRGGLAYAVDAGAVRYPTTYYVAVQYTF